MEDNPPGAGKHHHSSADGAGNDILCEHDVVVKGDVRFTRTERRHRLRDELVSLMFKKK